MTIIDSTDSVSSQRQIERQLSTHHRPMPRYQCVDQCEPYDRLPTAGCALQGLTEIFFPELMAIHLAVFFWFQSAESIEQTLMTVANWL